MTQNTFSEAIAGKKKISIIAEIKHRSPSFGTFEKHSDEALIEAYEAGGAAAISVVTEPTLFNGSLTLLKKIRRLTKLPILRKDFITTCQQIDESVEAGAQAILLIARILDQKKLSKLIEHAHKKKIEPVVEIHHPAEKKKIEKMPIKIIGINNRNLENFHIDVTHGKNLLRSINHAPILMVESGFSKVKDLKTYKKKADAALIGTALLTAENPQKLLESFVNA